MRTVTQQELNSLIHHGYFAPLSELLPTTPRPEGCIGYALGYDPKDGATILEPVALNTKRYAVHYNIGKVKYEVSYHKEGSFHKDGSEFFDVRLFKNKRDLARFVRELKRDGCVEL